MASMTLGSVTGTGTPTVTTSSTGEAAGGVTVARGDATLYDAGVPVARTIRRVDG